MDSLYEEVYKKLQIKFGDNLDVDFKDEKGDGKHFFLSIVSPSFSGKTRIERSQSVYEVLDEFMETGSIHALRMKLKSPDEL